MDNPITFLKMGYFDSSLYFKKKRTPLRRTTSYEIEFYTDGKGDSLVDGRSFPHKAGNMLICRPGSFRQSVQSFRCYFIHFTCADEDFENRYLKNLPVCMPVPDFERFKELMCDVSSAMATEGNSDLFFVTVKFYNLICALNQVFKQVRNESNPFFHLQQNVFCAEQYVQQHFAEKMGLKEMARAANLSPNYFLTVFKGLTGKTPNRYITAVRLNEAKKRLVNTVDGMECIAEQCGFDTQGYMCYVFKKELKISPKAYRDLYRKLI